jgi:hypothetical protein
MPAPAQIYQQEMHDNIGFFATWLPGDHLEVGDVGTFESGRFRKHASLSEFGLTLRVEKKGSPQNLQYTSRSGTNISINLDAAADVGVSGSAKIAIEFNQQGAFVFQAANVQKIELADKLRLADNIIKIEKWNLNWYIIDSIHIADCASIIISEDDAAGITLRANVDGDLGPVPLADTAVQFSVSSSNGRMLQVVAGRDLCPLFSCIKVKETWFSGRKIVPVRGQSSGLDQVPFVQPRISDILAS